MAIVGKKPIEVRKEQHFLRVDFTEPELKEFSKTLARETQNLAQAEEEKKLAVAQFAERIARCKSVQSVMSRNISNGYEMRMIECEVHLDLPRKGVATVFRTDTGEMVKERPMEPSELQRELPVE